MAAITPRRSARIPHMHTPKMSDRKKGLFQIGGDVEQGSLTQHRRLPVVDSESDSDCDLGIISTLDSSSGEDNAPKTPERNEYLHETRSHTKRLLKESQDFKNFIKSPFTLKKYQTRYSCPDSKMSTSTPATPRLIYHANTPSSTHSCASVHTTSSTSSRARKSLASLIADTESCSSSLKDLNFDSDSPNDSKENTPTKATRRSNRKKMTPRLSSFKGVLDEQKKNESTTSPVKLPIVNLTKMDIASFSPTQMMRTPHNTSETTSPPKIHHRKPVLEIEESPDSKCDSDKGNKRLRNDSMSETGPHCKYPKLETATAPKARLSLFNSDRLKEILSAKSFYGKSNPEINHSVSKKIASAIASTSNQYRKVSTSILRRKTRKPGQINLGVRHKIRKPKIHKDRIIKINRDRPMKAENSLNNSTLSNNTTINNSSMISQNTSQELDMDKADPFDQEKQTIDALLSQWEEEDVPATELPVNKPEVPCFNKTLIEETSQIFQPVTAVKVVNSSIMPSSESIVELGAKDRGNDIPQPETPVRDVVMSELTHTHKAEHGDTPQGQFLPVEGGYILVGEDQPEEQLLDLDEIDRELQMLDEQILNMAAKNNINAETVIATTENAAKSTEVPSTSSEPAAAGDKKMFPIFSNPKTGIAVSSTDKASIDPPARKSILKSVSDQYVIDAGQKNFGATQCTECGVIYEIGDPQDEHDHLVHHSASDALKFNGYKDERVISTFPNGGRCILIRGSEPLWKRVHTLLERVVHPQLGYGATLPKELVHTYTAYLYIEKKQMIGCAILEPKAKAYKLIPGDPDCCSVEDYPVKCGVSRLWTHKNRRRRGIAARLLDCARVSFLYGTALLPTDVAFSAPTTAGKMFATKYCGTENFYVYLE